MTTNSEIESQFYLETLEQVKQFNLDNVVSGYVKTKENISISDKIIIQQNNLIIALLTKIDNKLEFIKKGKTLDSVIINSKLDTLLGKEKLKIGKPSHTFIRK